MTDPQIQLSIAATVYCTGGYLAEFCSRCFSAACAAGYDPDRTEVVLVNDGCPRDGLERALAEREKDRRVRVVDLSRNFGHHLAMYVACEEARGERVFLIDSDL
nr:glycosyltransferase [uncultured Akkermansia sp.]